MDIMETYGRSMNESKCLLRLPTGNNSPPNGGALGEGCGYSLAATEVLHIYFLRNVQSLLHLMETDTPK